MIYQILTFTPIHSYLVRKFTGLDRLCMRPFRSTAHCGAHKIQGAEDYEHRETVHVQYNEPMSLTTTTTSAAQN